MLVAWAEPFVRATARFLAVRRAAAAASPLGSAALAGSSLPLDRRRAADALGFAAPSRNALDAIGNRDAALDLAHAFVRATIDASRISEELIAWAAPAYGYVRLGDAASTGSSLMPQKRNPDPFELVRARAAAAIGRYAGALGTLCGLAPSYQRDLQVTKSQIIEIVEDSLRTLEAFARAFDAVTFVREKMAAGALDGYTVATDLADALIAQGSTARSAHALVGAVVARAESEQRALNADDLAWLAERSGVASLEAPLDAQASIEGEEDARLDSARRGAAAARLAGIGARRAADAAVTRVHVTGAAGYAAAEALRWLHAHPFVEVGVVESRSHAGERLGDHFPLASRRTVPLRGAGQRSAERLRERRRDRRRDRRRIARDRAATARSRSAGDRPFSAVSRRCLGSLRIV